MGLSPHASVGGQPTERAWPLAVPTVDAHRVFSRFALCRVCILCQTFCSSPLSEAVRSLGGRTAGPGGQHFQLRRDARATATPASLKVVSAVIISASLDWAATTIEAALTEEEEFALHSNGSGLVRAQGGLVGLL